MTEYARVSPDAVELIPSLDVVSADTKVYGFGTGWLMIAFEGTHGDEKIRKDLVVVPESIFACGLAATCQNEFL